MREFDAPPEKVFRAHTDPDLLVRWLGPRNLTMTIDHYDCRTGGSYRYIHSRDGEDYGFHGSFHEVRPNELIVQTFTFEGMPDGVALEKLALEDLGDGRSRLTATSLVDSFAGRDAFVASGMETGVVEGYERLDEVLGGALMEMKLELVPLPVADVDRAKAFYAEQLGFVEPTSTCARARRPGGAADAAGLGLLHRAGHRPGAYEAGAGHDAGRCTSWSTTSRRPAPSWSGAASRSARCRTSAAACGTPGFSDPDGNRWTLQEMAWRRGEPVLSRSRRRRKNL